MLCPLSRRQQQRMQAETMGVCFLLSFAFTSLLTIWKGQRFCSIGRHQVSVEDCTSDDGTLRASCRVCLATRRRAGLAVPEFAPTVAPPPHREESARPLVENEEADGVEAAVIDEFDNVFGDG